MVTGSAADLTCSDEGDAQVNRSTCTKLPPNELFCEHKYYLQAIINLCAVIEYYKFMGAALLFYFDSTSSDYKCHFTVL